MSARPLSKAADPAHSPALEREPIVRQYLPPAGLQEALMAPLLRTGQRLLLKPVLRPPFPVWVQRTVLHTLALSQPGASGVDIRPTDLDGLPAERLVARGARPRHAVLFLHGGGFCAGSPRTHRAITTRLARLTGAEVLAPHYRRIPEHPFPAAVEDILKAYRQLLRDGYPPERIAIAGDSAGANMSFMSSMVLRAEGLPLPAALVMMAPVVDIRMQSRSMIERRSRDPIINPSWGRQILDWLKVPPGHPLGDPMAQDLSDLPPALVQVGEDEVLFDDAHWVANAAARAGRHVELEVYLKRWHVFQIHAAFLPGSMAALQRQADFMRQHWQD